MEILKILINGQLVEQVSQFRYFGSLMIIDDVKRIYEVELRWQRKTRNCSLVN